MSSKSGSVYFGLSMVVVLVVAALRITSYNVCYTKLLRVVGGTFAVTLMKFPLATTLGSFKVALKAFLYRAEKPDQIIGQSVELAAVARKNGLLGLEQVEIKNEFLKRGIQLVVDGHDPERVSKMLSNRITSYNVCYTKLLRPPGAGSAGG